MDDLPQPSMDSPSINERPPPSLDGRSPPTLDERSLPPSMDGLPQPSTNGPSLPRWMVSPIPQGTASLPPNWGYRQRA
ncbi:hypothetical protein K443DRAFT_108277 [Laccaria amethystina LaAM-08-1]|uniref:Uncharacterized protein n=1 Tax=Laccaria amethystina LaAM-08-1 TaxID=1095629 RepID=A0A0C9WK42_9AGAR|nr:hypothetical protein K443DRAFT_108277 [Laccaria amethystina LaAM-08-1]